MDLHLAATQILLATDRSLAESIREALLPKILEQFPSGYFEDKLYDTHERGKGFISGFVSFGLKPAAWASNGLIGGILVRGNYLATFRSNSPDTGTPERVEWEKAGGNADLEGGEVPIMDLEGGYYNKAKGGSFSMGRSLGQATFTVDKLEGVGELELTDPGGMKAALGALVDEVLEDPPEGAKSRSKSVQRKLSPYSSLQKFVKYLAEEDRRVFRMNEVDAISQFTGKRPQHIIDWLRKGGLNLDTGSRSASLILDW